MRGEHAGAGRRGGRPRPARPAPAASHSSPDSSGPLSSTQSHSRNASSTWSRSIPLSYTCATTVPSVSTAESAGSHKGIEAGGGREAEGDATRRRTGPDLHPATNLQAATQWPRRSVLSGERGGLRPADLGSRSVRRSKGLLAWAGLWSHAKDLHAAQHRLGQDGRARRPLEGLGRPARPSREQIRIALRDTTHASQITNIATVASGYEAATWSNTRSGSVTFWKWTPSTRTWATIGRSTYPVLDPPS
jgi:hypothetical protein